MARYGDVDCRKSALVNSSSSFHGLIEVFCWLSEECTERIRPLCRDIDVLVLLVLVPGALPIAAMCVDLLYLLLPNIDDNVVCA